MNFDPIEPSSKFLFGTQLAVMAIVFALSNCSHAQAQTPCRGVFLPNGAWWNPPCVPDRNGDHTTYYNSDGTRTEFYSPPNSMRPGGVFYRRENGVTCAIDFQTTRTLWCRR